MIEAKTKSLGRQISSNKSLVIAIFLVLLIVLGLYGYNAFRAFRTSSPQSGGVSTIAQSALEENYGLRVQLVAVTAAGGLVDLRLQIVDAEKAKAFLADRTNFPTLRVGDSVVLRTSEDVATQEIQFENGKSIFVLFPNAGNTLKPGDPVNIVFGDLQLEAIQAK
jgi:hypothetical protein